MTIVNKKRFAVIVDSEISIPNITEGLSVLWSAKKSNLIEIVLVEYCSLKDNPDRSLHLLMDISVCGIDYVVANEYSEMIAGFLRNKFNHNPYVIHLPKNSDPGFRDFRSIILGATLPEKKESKVIPAKKTTIDEIMKNVEKISMRDLAN